MRARIARKWDVRIKQCSLATSVAFVALTVTACMVGPDFHPPAAPTTTHYTKPTTPAKTTATPSAGDAGQAQVLALQQTLPENWWYLLGSDKVNTLVKQGLVNSPTLTAAKATLAEAQETMQADIGNLLFPAIDYNAQAQRLRTSAISIGGSSNNAIFNLYNTSLNVSYSLDIWGGSRRAIESAAAQVDYEYDELLATYLTLSSNIVSTSIAIASLRDQIQATRALMTDQQQILTITQQQYHEGGASYQDVLLQQTELAQTEATLPPLNQALAETNHSLAVLLGQLTSDTSPLNLSLSQLKLPVSLPISLPAALIKQRPDIQASQALLHVASANIGVATANLLPEVTLTGNNGYVSSSLANFISKKNNVWSFGAKLMQPVFHGGALWATRKAAIDAFDVAAANYQQTLLLAFQNVADALTNIQQDALEFNRQYMANHSALESLKITQQQYRLGGVNYLTVLNAQEKYEETTLAFIKAKAARFADTVSLYQALGGGWWQDPAMKPQAYGVVIHE